MTTSFYFRFGAGAAWSQNVSLRYIGALESAINLDWLKNSVVREKLTNGIRPKQNEVQTILYCNDESQAPDFALDVSLQFDECEPKCYRAYIVNHFGN